MTVGVLYFLLMRNDFLAQNPDLEAFYRPYIVAAIAMILGTLALLNGQKWGIWVLLAGFSGVFIIETITGFPWEKTIRIPLAALVLFLLMRWNKKI